MKRSGILLATVFGAALVASGSAPAAEVACFYNGALHPCVYYSGYPTLPASAVGIGSGLAAGIGSGLAAAAAAPLTLAGAATAPLMTGRSVAVSGGISSPVSGRAGGPGNYCATSVKTCLLYEPGWLGTGCSCRVSDGLARGFVE